MKKIFLALMATATFVACNKEDKDEDGTSAKFPKEITTIVGTERTVIKYEMQDATRPKKETRITYRGNSSYGDETYHDYDYDSSGRLQRRTYYSKEPYFHNYIYTYRADGKLEKEETIALGTTLYATKVYEYRADGRLVKKEDKPANNNDGSYITTTFDYPSTNVVRITKNTYVRKGGKNGDDTNEWHSYTLDAKGNVVKDEYTTTTHSYEVTYEYDAKINPEYVNFIIQTTPDHFVTLLTPNNIIKKTVVTAELNKPENVTKTVYRYDIQYDGDYPIRIKVYSVPKDEKAPQVLISTTEYSY